MKNLLSLSKYFGLILVFIVSLLSCSKETDRINIDPKQDVYVENGRLAFKDGDAFDKTLSQLRKISTEEVASEWENKFNYSSLRKYNSTNRDKSKLEAMRLPLYYKILLNENCEYTVGETIIWFNDGYVHFIDNQDESFLQEVKANPELSKNKAPVITNVYPISDKQINGSISAGSAHSYYQHEWALNCASGPWRKTVYELRSTASPTYIISGDSQPRYNYSLDIAMKLEWHGSGGWQPNANELRYVSVDLNATMSTQCAITTPPPFSTSFTGWSNYDININLGQGTSYAPFACNNSSNIINYSINGSLFSRVYINGTCNGTLQTESPYTKSGALWE